MSLIVALNIPAWKRRLGVACAGIALLCCLAAPGNGAFSPGLNWDMLAYVGIIKSWSQPAPVDFQAAAYADVQSFAEAARAHGFKALVGGSDYRRIVAADPIAFNQQLPFYRIRPLYLWTVRAVSAFTPTVAAACVAVSVLAALAINLLIATLAFRRLGACAGSGAVVVVALSPLLIDLAQSKTPDALYALFVACGVLLLSERRDLAGVLVLLGSTAVRSDAMLLNGLVALALTAERFAGRRKGNLLAPGILFAGSLALGQTIGWLAGAYPFRVLYAVTFIGYVPYPASLAGTPIPLFAIGKAWLGGISGALANGGLWAILAELVVIGMLLARGRDSLRDRLTTLATGLTLCTAARFVLFPEHDLRLNAPVFVALAILLIRAAGSVERSGVAIGRA